MVCLKVQSLAQFYFCDTNDLPINIQGAVTVLFPDDTNILTEAANGLGANTEETGVISLHI
jgi:hypothetical protein